MDWSISRRQLIAFTSAYAVFQSQLPIPWPRAETATARVRENIRVFAEDPEKVTALRLAIKTMKEKSANNKHDPLGWDYITAFDIFISHTCSEAGPPSTWFRHERAMHGQVSLSTLTHICSAQKMTTPPSWPTICCHVH